MKAPAPPYGAVAYVRVSTTHQDLATQRHALEQIAKGRGIEIGRWYEDTASGKKAGRPGWEACLGALRRGEASVLVVYRLDRIGRSLTHLVGIIGELQTLHTRVVLGTGDLDTDTPQGRVLWSMAAVFAEFEADLIRERVNSGLARARAEGTRLGRPPSVDPDEARTMVERVGSVRQAAKLLRCSPSTVLRALKRGEAPLAAS